MKKIGTEFCQQKKKKKKTHPKKGGFPPLFFFFLDKGKITKLSTLLQQQKLCLKEFHVSVENIEALTLPKRWACKNIFWVPSPQLLFLAGEKILVVHINKSPSG